MNTFMHDLRFGIRMLRKQPGSSAIAILALALGIGLTTMMFSIVYGAMLRGLPFEKPDQLLTVASTLAAEDRFDMAMSIHDFVEMREQQTSFEDLSASSGITVNLSDGGNPERYNGALITPEAFSLLGVQPFMGRLLQTADNVTGAPDVMLINYDVWKNRFASDPQVIGRVQRANGKPTTIVGVMPERFAYPQNESVWLPLREDPSRVKRGEGDRVDVMGRIRDDVSIDAAVLELNGIARRIADMNPETNKGVGAAVTPYIESSFGKEPIALLYTMLGAVFLVLLMACTNVANLLISRAAARAKEVGVRTALGASRFRVVRQFMVESLIISGIGAVVGVGIAYAGARLFTNAIVDTNPPFWIDVKIDGGVVVFVFGVTLIATILAGAFPAWSAARTSVNEVLKDEARGSSSLRLGRLSRALVVLEIALSAGLLVGAGLIIRSITNLGSVDYGFSTRDVFTARVALTQNDYPDEESRRRFFETLVERVREVPGVEDVAASTALPGRGSNRMPFAVDGGEYPDAKYPFAGQAQVSPRFLDAVGTPLVSGRMFAPHDRDGALPVAIVTQSFARKYLGGGDPIGRRIRLNPGRDGGDPFRTIVGVTPDAYMNGLTDEDQSAIMIPLAQSSPSSVAIMARVDGRPMEITDAVRKAVASIDPDQPLHSAMTLQESIDRDNWFYRVFGALFMSFGIAALFLASVGLYGVMATSVSQRTREMGVRMALGASTRDVLRLVMNEGMLQLSIGLALGFAFSLAVSRVLSMLLFQVAPRDPATFITIGVMLVLTATAASLVPAMRAARVQPVQAMRDD